MKMCRVPWVLPACLLSVLLLADLCNGRSVNVPTENDVTDKTPISSASKSNVRKETNEIGDCLLGSETRDTCEKCAKSTRAMLAYPLCCEGSVNVRNWCQEFLSYTLKV